jgi:hypothetical protein
MPFVEQNTGNEKQPAFQELYSFRKRSGSLDGVFVGSNERSQNQTGNSCAEFQSIGISTSGLLSKLNSRSVLTMSVVLRVRAFAHTTMVGYLFRPSSSARYCMPMRYVWLYR